MRILLKDGKKKVLTLSYDDGVVQDIRLIGIMNKHGLKGTFNINTGLYFPEDGVRERFYGRMKLSEAKELYIGSGQEVAVHALTHPFLEKLEAHEIIHEIIEDRRNIEREYGCIARGMAYPYGTYSEAVIDVLDKCGIAYARTTKSTNNFFLPDNWLALNPTCHHRSPELMKLAEKFAEQPTYGGYSAMFYVWGHSYEFDNNDNWNVIEKFAEYIGGREDIWYATNIEIYDYVMAYKSLHVSYEQNIVHNPSALDVWFEVRGADTELHAYHIAPGETIRL